MSTCQMWLQIMEGSLNQLNYMNFHILWYVWNVITYWFIKPLQIVCKLQIVRKIRIIELEIILVHLIVFIYERHFMWFQSELVTWWNIYRDNTNSSNNFSQMMCETLSVLITIIRLLISIIEKQQENQWMFFCWM